MPKDERPAVLFVDDEILNRQVFEANFGTHFRVITCSRGSEALALLEAKQHEFAVVIADQRMPDLTGVQVLEQFRIKSPDTYRMMITGYADIGAITDAVNRSNVQRYFEKPWKGEQLQAALEEALRVYNLQNRLREIESRMLKSANLLAIGQVSAAISHELTNPVAYLSSSLGELRVDLEMLTEYVKPFLEAKPNQKVSDALAEISELLAAFATGVSHVQGVALKIRNHARGADFEETAEVSDVVNFAYKIAANSFRDYVGHIRMDGPKVRVKGGPVHLGQVLINLVTNSGQAMMGRSRKGIIEIDWKEIGDKVVLRVIDDGCGIPEELHEKVFEPLFTTKPPGIGTGLGLGICRDLVRGMGGEIKLQSKVGEGTTFEITLLKAPSEA